MSGGDVPVWAKPAKRPSKTLQVLFGVLGSLVLLAVVAGYIWSRVGLEPLKAEAQATMAEGRRLGPRLGVAGCLENAIKRRSENGAFSFTGRVRERVFLESCFDASAATTPDVCDTLPDDSSILKMSAWTLAQCEPREVRDHCTDLYQPLFQHCRRRKLHAH